MRRFAIASLGALACLICGCGSQTKTVSVAQAPQPSTPTTTQAGTTTAPARTTQATTATTTTPEPAASTSTTRTAPEPSFTEHERQSGSAALTAAVAAVRARGYTPVDTSEYHPSQTLQVLVGRRSGSSEGYGEQAFFFLEGHYLGTDAKEPSAKLRVVSQEDTEVAIEYPLYRSGDPLCCPGGGERVVHFALDDGKLSSLDPIPPAHSSTQLSRN